jgi:hypothetical protein
MNVHITESEFRIEETWQLWQKLIDDCRDFGDWLKGMESEVTDVTADQLNVSTSSEEYSRCEVCYLLQFTHFFPYSSLIP